jgi:hypothetical protein
MGGVDRCPACLGWYGEHTSRCPGVPHRYFSGVFHDTYPGEAIGCCDLPRNHPAHGEQEAGDGR